MLIVIELDEGASIPFEVLRYCHDEDYTVEQDGNMVYISNEPERVEYYSYTISKIIRQMDYKTAMIVYSEVSMMKFMKFIFEFGHVAYTRWLDWGDEHITLLDQMMALSMFEKDIEGKEPDRDKLRLN